jgi:[protein-PII] uridylyltransferase
VQRANFLSELTSFYKSKRERIYSLHTAGTSGLGIVTALSDLIDQIVLKAVDYPSPGALQGWGGTLVAIGGYGRREISPASDIDLMFLIPTGDIKAATQFANDFLCLLWDMKLTVGHSFRTIDDCVETARQDTIIATSMLTARFIAGNSNLFSRFQKTFFSKVAYHDQRVLLEHNAERGKEEQTPYLQEPNIKTSPGGLRDIHRMKWIALPRYRTSSLSELYKLGRLTSLEHQGLISAQDFLWRVRNTLHFQNAGDQLTIERQEEIAPLLQFHDRRDFMRQYYISAGTIANVSVRFIRNATPKPPWYFISRWLKHQIDPDFYILDDKIFPTAEGLHHFFEKDENCLRLFLLAKEHKKVIPGSVMEILIQTAGGNSQALWPLSNRALFRRFLSTPGGIATTLRKMHQTGVLWRIIPEFSRIYCLVQESRSHFFTTDEHTFRTIEEAEKLMEDQGLLGTMYAEIRRKDILHLALLLHDIGKGMGGDHSQHGAKIAESVSHLLGYDEEERALLIFLVDRHLLFSDVAFYRDFTNEPILLTFARAVGRPETLKMLLVLTVADIRAVGPGTWTSWKWDLLFKLHDEALEVLTGGGLYTKRDEMTRARLVEATQGEYPDVWRSDLLQALTPRYLSCTPFDKIKTHIAAFYRAFTKPVQVTAHYNTDSEKTEYTLYTTDAPGLFLKVVGVLVTRGLSIISADIFTQSNGMVVDIFCVIDPYMSGPPRSEQIEAIALDIQHVVEGTESIEALLKKGGRHPRSTFRVDSRIPVQVEVDNESSHAFTIIDIFAPDFPGLLYLIAQTLFDLGLSVHSARIATRLDQILDVFYVQGDDHGKVTDMEEIKRIKSHLKENIERILPKPPHLL